MAFRHNHSSIVVVVEKSIVDVEVMEPIKDKVVAMIDPSVFDSDLMGVVGKLDKTKPLLKVVLPFDLVDDESVEIIDNVVPVWIDSSQTEFNPATMAKVAWNQTSDAMPKNGNQTIGKRKVYDDVYDSITIGNDATIDGDIYGSVTVKSGVKVVVDGDVYGITKMEQGSEMVVDGDVYGTISNDGGTVRVFGDVYGNISNINGGQSFLEDDDCDEDDQDDCDDMDDENEVEDGNDYKDIYKSLTIDHDATVGGDIYGSVTVKSGVKVMLDGDVYGIVRMEQGSEMIVKGDVYGTINNDGGIVRIFGDTHGKINNINEGQSFLEKNGDGKEKIEKIPKIIRDVITAPFKQMIGSVIRSVGADSSNTEKADNTSFDGDIKDASADTTYTQINEKDANSEGQKGGTPHQD